MAEEDLEDSNYTPPTEEAAPQQDTAPSSGGYNGDDTAGATSEGGTGLDSALKLVKEVLQYGYKKFGVDQGGQQQQGGYQPNPQVQQQRQTMAAGAAPTENEPGAGHEPIGLPEQPHEENEPTGMRNPQVQQQRQTMAAGAAPLPDQPLPTHGAYQSPDETSMFGDASLGRNQQGPQRPSMIMRMLMGDGANPEDTSRAEGLVSPERFAASYPQLPEDLQRPLSVAAAKEKFGDDSALAVLQGYRQANQGFLGKAAGALAHNDVEMAARLASKAASFIPSGYHLSFEAAGNSGVIANLADAGGKITKTPLTVSQFNEYLHGPAGQFDHVIENGEAQSIQMLEKSPGVPLGTPGAGAPARGTPGGGGPQQPEPGAVPRGYQPPTEEETKAAKSKEQPKHPKSIEILRANQKGGGFSRESFGVDQETGHVTGPGEAALTPQQAFKQKMSLQEQDARLGLEGAKQAGREKITDKQTGSREKITGRHEEGLTAGRAQNLQLGIAKIAAGKENTHLTSAARYINTFINKEGVDKMSPAMRSEAEDIIRRAQETGSVEPSGSQQPAGGGAPTPGTIKDGFKFKGGNPAAKESWERVQ